LFFLVILGGENVWGQKWLWFEQANNYNSLSSTTPLAITTDPIGNVIEVGQLQDSAIFSSFIVNASLSGNNSQGAYIVKYSPSGNVLWAKAGKVDWAGEACASAVACDGSGNIYVTGYFFGSLSFDALTITTAVTNPPSESYFIAKFDPNGNILWLQGSNSYQSCSSYGSGVSVDPAGNVYLVGNFNDTVNFQGDELTSTSDINSFIVKYNPNGNVKWAKYSLADGSLFYSACTCDPFANIYTTGAFTNNLYCYPFPIYSGGQFLPDMFLIKYDSSGNVNWAKTGTVSNSTSQFYVYADIGFGIATDASGNIYITGNYGGNVQIGAFNLPAAAQSNLFLAEYNSSGNVLEAQAMVPVGGGGEGSYGTSVSLDKWGNIYVSGNLVGENTLGGMTIGYNSISTENNFIIKLDNNFKALCGTSFFANEYYSDVVADPLTPSVYYTSQGDIGFTNILNITPSGGAFMAKWTCDTCKIKDTIIAGKTIICSGESTTLKGAGGPGFVWSTGSSADSISVAPLITTTYTLFISNGVCYGDTTITINVNQSPIPSFNFKSKICTGNTDTITALGGLFYKWGNGDTLSTIIVSPASATTYYITISNNLCSINDSVNVRVYPYPVPQITGEQYVCSGQSATISASGGTIYSWSTGDTTSSISITPVSTSTYSLIISNGVCTVNDSSTVMVNPSPNVNVCCDSSITHGENVQLITSGGQIFHWSPSAGLSCDSCPDPIATPTITTTYSLTVISDSGCISARTVTIEVSCGTVFIPTAFSPDETVNAILYVRGPCIASMDFNVFDRWGNKVFESQNQDKGWDGTCKGLPANMGTYVWFLNATMLDGTSVEKKGNITLVR